MSMTPEAVQGRKHIDVQTGQMHLCTAADAATSVVCLIHCHPLFSELYLEELSDVVVATDAECQTDVFLDKPATPLFIPDKSGKDAETQIQEGEVGDPDICLVKCEAHSFNIRLVIFFRMLIYMI